MMLGEVSRQATLTPCVTTSAKQLSGCGLLRMDDGHLEYSTSPLPLDTHANGVQQAQTQRIINSARSIQTMAQQASAFVNLSTRPASLPTYVHLEPHSEWFATALATTAVESALLPTRLTPGGGRRALLTDFEAILNTNGKQKLFQLSASVPQNTAAASTNMNAKDKAHPHTNGPSRTPEFEVGLGSPTYVRDLDYTPSAPWPSVPGHSHIFGQIDVYRKGSLHHDSTVAEMADMGDVRDGEKAIVER
jgi:hypothetical protein